MILWNTQLHRLPRHSLECLTEIVYIIIETSISQTEVLYCSQKLDPTIIGSYMHKKVLTTERSSLFSIGVRGLLEPRKIYESILTNFKNFFRALSRALRWALRYPYKFYEILYSCRVWQGGYSVGSLRA